jgi:hypothetical protein
MKLKSMLPITAVLLGSSLIAGAQPGEMFAFSRNLDGELTISSTRPGGCGTLVCTTNMVTSTFCYTNCYEKLVCTTNASTGQLQCTNVRVCDVRCFTNTFPEITCTNEFLNPTTVSLGESLIGGLTIAGCDELGGETNLVFQARISATLRTNDWRGSHFGTFKILSGTNVIAFGGMTGVNGSGSHRGLEPCAICNHIEGTLQGQIVQSGPLWGARLQAAYAGNLPNVSCPSTNAPQGAISLGIEGDVIVPCFTLSPIAPLSGPLTGKPSGPSTTME